MKKCMLVVMLMLLGMVGVVKADSIKLNLGVFKLDLQGDLNGVGMVDSCHNSNILTGLATSLGNIPVGGTTIDLSAGAFTGGTDTTIPFLSLGHRWSVSSAPFLSKIGLGDLYLGVGAGYKFDDSIENKSKNVVCGLTLSTNILSLTQSK